MATTDLVELPQSDSAGDGWYRFAPGIRGEGTTARRAWQARYVRRMVLLDVLCSVVAAAAGYALWFEWGEADDLHPRRCGSRPVCRWSGCPRSW